MNQSRTDTSTKTNAQLLLLIVVAQRDCVCGCHTATSSIRNLVDHTAFKCPPCSGTGKVPILDPGLMRLPCPWCDGKGRWCVGLAQSALDPHCQGRNWVPNSNAWDMKKALHLAGYQLVEEYDLIRRRWVAAVYRYVVNLGIPRIAGDADPARARLLAVGYVLEAL